METVVDYLFVLLLAQNLKISENDNVLHPYKRFSSYLIFCIIFEERYFSCYILLIDLVFVWLPLPCEILGNMRIVIVC